FQLFPALVPSSLDTGGWLAVLVFAIIPLAALSAVLTEMHRTARGMAIASLLPAAQGSAVALLLALSLAFSLRPTTEQLL
ncbi:hypothetical protein, partial [Stenotrophomonas maltophilia]|uniref:hypothetical protein n=1 Tax=Stenotrophomonas maltophilia TaxID=40324 RepID=UPI0013DC3332